MATLALSALGSAAGSALLPSGLSILGTSIAGATLGSQLGSLAGAQIDQALFGGSGRGRAVDGPRLSDLRVMTSTEGAHIPRLYGRSRLGGQIIWATALKEEAVERTASGGGKGTRTSTAPTGSDFLYFANFAVALCEGQITALGRVWADGREIDISDYTYRLYTGSESQFPDPLISAKQDGSAPAYRGLAYIVFEHLPLTAFGNRLPQLSFEVSRAVDTLEQDLRGVVLIPGSGEFVYAPQPIDRQVGRISNVSENVHTSLGGSDWSVSLDQLQTNLPNATSISFVVSWFGDDLRTGTCQIRPLVESNTKITSPQEWSVAGLDRSTAATVSRIDNRAAYGGTPSDQTVVDAIRDLKARGLSVVYSPFILMDVAAGNTLPDPYTGASTQPTYPWRGRITVSPAAGQPATPDKTAAASAQLASFIGTAQVSHFSLNGEQVIYTGPTEWSFRRFILHNAHLALAAGNVDAFVLCSELRGLSTVRSNANTYPFVAALVQLASDVRTILGPTTKILYAADWSEYFGHQPPDGSGDVHFHLDPLWASPDIDCVGIDLYWPLADWRDGASHLDALAGSSAIHDLDYLKSNLSAGEGYDWYYASDANRSAQTRTAITDGAGKPWVFRYKDIKSWWVNAHFNRPAGIESTTPTAWIPQSKPFWLMEIGCPAIDKGANQPNVFVDPKSSESFIPRFSSGSRDDLMQRRLLQTFAEAYNPAHAGFVASLNPVSSVYGGRMLDPARIHVTCWDARPFPAFPNHSETWGNAANYRVGHWINGRTASAPLPALVTRLLVDFDFTDADANSLTGTAAGFVIDRIMSAREALQPLELGFFFDSLESEGRILFRPRGAAPTQLTLTPDDLVEISADHPLLRLTRAQETDLPAAAKVTYISSTGDYPQAVGEARKLAGVSGRVSQAALGIVLDPSDADTTAERMLFEAWTARERAVFSLPPSRLALEPGDTLTLTSNGRANTVRITDIGDHNTRDIEARSIDASIYTARSAPPRDVPSPKPQPAGAPLVIYLDCPPALSDPPQSALVAAAQDPWPGAVAILRSPETTGYTLSTVVTRAATTGLTASTFTTGVHGRIDPASSVLVTLDRGTLTSVTQLALFAGANTIAIEVAPAVWEILQFQTATLVAAGTYRLSNLLRGQRGTEHVLTATVPIGARFVLLDDAVRRLDLSINDIGLTLNWRAGPANRDIGDSAYKTSAHVFTGKGLAPLAPVHIKATRNAAGDLALSWTRRTRTGGDSWGTLDVPLGETSESYALDILLGATVKRTLTVTSPTAGYSALDQTTDFGSPQNPLSIRLAQLSPTHGRGTSRTLVV